MVKNIILKPMKDKKQTAVEWLIEQMKKPYADKHIMDILDQAKAMEKEQIIEAYNTGELHCVADPKTSLDYYQHYYGQ